MGFGNTMIAIVDSHMQHYGTLGEPASDLKRPSFRTPHTMDPRTWFRDLTPYFLYILFVATLGPLLFGFHLVRMPHISFRQLADSPSRQN